MNIQKLKPLVIPILMIFIFIIVIIKSDFFWKTYHNSENISLSYPRNWGIEETESGIFISNLEKNKWPTIIQIIPLECIQDCDIRTTLEIEGKKVFETVELIESTISFEQLIQFSDCEGIFVDFVILDQSLKIATFPSRIMSLKCDEKLYFIRIISNDDDFQRITPTIMRIIMSLG